MSTFINFSKELLASYKKDNVPLLAAAQAYYYLLSIFPLLIVCFAILPYLNMDPAEVMSFLERSLPNGIATVFEENIVNLIETPKGGLLTVGIIGALWSATNGVQAFMTAANEAYGVDETRSFIKVRLLSLALTIGMVISFAIALLLPVFGSTILTFLKSLFGISSSLVIILQVSKWVVSILLITIILSIFYLLAPSQKLPLKHIFPGAITASVLWSTISLGFSFYVSNFASYSATYGSLGGIIILMIWFYLTGMILMIGAEINVLYHKRHQPESMIRKTS